MEFNPIATLNHSQQRWKIKVRVIRKWETIYPSNAQAASLDYLLLDEHGDTIQATAVKKDIPYFEGILQQGEIIILSGFTLTYSKKKYRISPHDYTIQMNRGVSIRHTSDDTAKISYELFQFTEFEELQAKKNNAEFLIDVIGAITSISGPIPTPTRYGITTKKMLTIINHRAHHNNMKEVTVIKATQDNKIDQGHQLLENRKTIQQLLELNPDECKNIKFTCLATIVDIDTSKGWWYNSCPECHSGINDYNVNIWCDRCGELKKKPIPWYRLKTSIQDETGTADMLIFGITVEKMLTIPASQLAYTTKTKRNEMHPIFGKILNKEKIFQLRVSAQNDNPTTPMLKAVSVFDINHELQEKSEDPTTRKGVAVARHHRLPLLHAWLPTPPSPPSLASSCSRSRRPHTADLRCESPSPLSSLPTRDDRKPPSDPLRFLLLRDTITSRNRRRLQAAKGHDHAALCRRSPGRLVTPPSAAAEVSCG
ncbi:hypothetical protein Tsubulata_012054 [Turnera subulata]|uniref:Replication factor A C-terminal domain-containing protein n=1 Tax=Turnera subulata TaxID=218843 RepID=A0A9Q0FB37_9ROSI|nr:hypothetical protein Tsubulata_012054 [Turnera subulata]